MLKSNSFFKKIVFSCLTLLLVIVAWTWLISAPASSQTQSQINALEVDLNGIESRLNRIEAQLNQLGRFAAPTATPPPSRSNSGRNTPLSRDQMFDRLATLVIELKQQVNKLETRVSKLESGRRTR
ncbi:MAG: hypothetical protein KME05_15625 [Gloeocapsa sp. UFS-A4-WI-NPMV-4B04]|jgi:cell division protein FtsB|nr:hypothetical protein [Gloeocapsa sp. UFS-A4-WI-NPMV-4B04]